MDKYGVVQVIFWLEPAAVFKILARSKTKRDLHKDFLSGDVQM